MKPATCATLLLLSVLPVLLAGCLEVEQHPVWRDGAYDGKPDNRPAQAHFRGDRLAWNAVLMNRNQQQNEYARTRDAKTP